MMLMIVNVDLYSLKAHERVGAAFSVLSRGRLSGQIPNTQQHHEIIFTTMKTLSVLMAQWLVVHMLPNEPSTLIEFI